MGKKSAKARGYRKQKTVKPYLSKKEIFVVCLIAVLLIAAIVFINVFKDGSVRVVNNQYQDIEPDWILNNGSYVMRGCYKIAEAGEIEGYEKQEESVPVGFSTYTADEGKTTLMISGYPLKTGEAVKQLKSKAEVTEITEGTAGERAYISYTQETSAYIAPDTEEAPAEAEEAPAEETEEAGTVEEPEPNTFVKTIFAYTDADVHKSCVEVKIIAEADSAEALPADEALRAEVEKAIAAVTFEQKK